MDSLLTAAAQALARGDPLGALQRVALRDDAPSLALRGIAMAQLGDLARAKALLRKAARAFGPREVLARARCVVAEAEVALAARELGFPPRALEAARATLEIRGDFVNAAHARLLGARRLLLIGRLDEAECALAARSAAPLPPALHAAHALARAGIAMRRLRAAEAEAGLHEAMLTARLAGIPALLAEVEAASRLLVAPAARLLVRGEARTLRLAEVEAVLATEGVVVDACRYAVRRAGRLVPLASRPVLFTLVRALAEAWPGDATREALLRQAYRAREADESHRARLRVEIARLRVALRGLAEIRATPRGFALLPPAGAEVAVLARLVEETHAMLLAFLADGEAWSSSALALATGSSQRSVQRALEELAAEGKAQPLGRGRARRWTVPAMPGFATGLLLTPALPGG